MRPVESQTTSVHRKELLGFRAGRTTFVSRWRSAHRLCSWIDDAVTSRFQALAQFAKTLRRDRRAVELALTTPWNNGPVEGQINRLKVIKRQMYGRVGFQLLKVLVLPSNHSYP